MLNLSTGDTLLAIFAAISTVYFALHVFVFLTTKETTMSRTDIQVVHLVHMTKFGIAMTACGQRTLALEDAERLTLAKQYVTCPACLLWELAARQHADEA